MNQFAVRPQSTVRLCPVIPDVSSEARKANADATSSGRTSRRIGTCANEPFMYAVNFGPTAFSVMSMCVNPGETPLTLMPAAARVAHRTCDALRHSIDAGEVGGDHGVPPLVEHVEEWGLVVDPGVVHEHVDPVPSLERCPDRPLHVLGQ
jgi:hypothetical protein